MDYKVVIDAGHGGTDSGAVGGGIIEKDLTLQISNYIYNRLNELGIPVKMTRTTDETLSPSERVRRVLNAYGNEPNVLVVSNHINAGGGDGAEVIYALRNDNTFANLILNEISKEGQNIRRAFQRRLPSNQSKDYYFMLRDTGVTEPVIIEYGFLDSPNDDINQLKNNYQNYAEAVVRAITEYIGASYQSIPGSDTYIVQRGDSLWSIARKLNVSVEELKAANNLSSNLIGVNQVLRIPVTSSQPIIGEYSTYIVKPGDTLYEIASSNNTTVDRLIEYNNLSSSIIAPGQSILIPVKMQPEVEDYITYIVKAGDNLYAISRNYGLSVDELMRFNNLNTNILNIGQTIKIPVSETDSYMVKSGDSLYSIARKYNTTVDSLKQKNNLTSNTINVGQILKI